MKKSDDLFDDIKDSGLEVKAYKSKYIIMYRDQKT